MTGTAEGNDSKPRTREGIAFDKGVGAHEALS